MTRTQWLFGRACSGLGVLVLVLSACTEAQIPVAGCQADRECGAEERCFEGSCVGCLAACPASEVCVRAQCVATACGDEVCLEGEVCIDGSCANSLCVDVECAEGELCAGGNCYPRDCSGVMCGEQEVCIDGGCEPTRCYGVECREGSTCEDGLCAILPGWACTQDGCSALPYRVALVNKNGGSVDVASVSLKGGASVTRSLAKGYNPESSWPEWSADGTQLAYAGGPPGSDGSVYLFDVDTSSTAYGWFPGMQPGFAQDAAKVIASHADGYSLFQTAAATFDSHAVGTSQLRWPKFDPGDSGRFAFIDATDGSLKAHGSSSDYEISAGTVVAFSWLSGGGKLVLLRRGATSCSLVTVEAGASSAGAEATVADNLACDARLFVSPTDANRVGLALGSSIDVYSLSTRAIEATIALEQSALDVAWTGDGALLVVLAAEANASSATVYLVAPEEGATAVSTGLSGDYQFLRATAY